MVQSSSQLLIVAREKFNKKIHQMSNKKTYPYMFKELGPNMSHEFCTHEMEGPQFYTLLHLDL
jgi:hypothetical protein